MPSRAEFPLTEAFAEYSNNSRVGLTGWAVLIEDVKAWRAEGGGYYECDPKVMSEVCLPVQGQDDNVLGILDAEASSAGFFTPEAGVAGRVGHRAGRALRRLPLALENPEADHS